MWESTEEDKNERAFAWMAALQEERAGRLSWQVLQEYCVTVTRKSSIPLGTEPTLVKT